ncbi:DUF4167 domain-containing protein [Pseudoruegeria sp. SK021]|uniref:DUF4167 domain-containing protein n=1 Tax=Pseudoruegeria sp. SK021 TaxID=1933035 RepID=UPI000A2375AF|nr:DUF4167 domain-containing protein [Pseudoruegeria sp. SK021]OSP55424.1 hypothetical protein BV911_07170 [Pseudoruegeria sp. SK021]
MRSSKSRSRSKSNRTRSGTMGNILNRVFESSGPEGKVRGTPQQIIDKYNQLTRDAQLSNDRVAAENFQQHSEHYTRLLGEAQREADQRREQQESQGQNRQRDHDQRGGQGSDPSGSSEDAQRTNQSHAGDGAQPEINDRPRQHQDTPRPRHQDDASDRRQDRSSDNRAHEQGRPQGDPSERAPQPEGANPAERTSDDRADAGQAPTQKPNRQRRKPVKTASMMPELPNFVAADDGSDSGLVETPENGDKPQPEAAPKPRAARKPRAPRAPKVAKAEALDAESQDKASDTDPREAAE